MLIAYSKLDLHDTLNKIFIYVSSIILVGLVFEAVTCIINGQPYEWMRIMSIIMHMFLFMSSPILAFFWLVFTYIWLRKTTIFRRIVLFALIVPVILNILIVIASAFTPSAFYINENNVYERGPLFWYPVIVANGYLVTSAIIVFFNRNNILKEEFFPLVIFAILPLIVLLFKAVFMEHSTCGVPLLFHLSSSLSFSMGGCGKLMDSPKLGFDHPLTIY
jgi:hypothetical protein